MLLALIEIDLQCIVFIHTLIYKSGDNDPLFYFLALKNKFRVEGLIFSRSNFSRESDGTGPPKKVKSFPEPKRSFSA